MPVKSDNNALLELYLNLLGIVPGPPSLEALSELVTAHLTRIPFENLSKLYNRKHGADGLPDLKQYLDGIKRYHFGGTCYTNNYFFHLLLKHLGYDVILCGADMDNPDVHIVNRVTIDSREYLVDGGYGAPFLLPLPLDMAQDQTIASGNECYLIKPRESDGSSRVEHWRDGTLIHGYLAKPIPRQIEHFSSVIARSYSDDAMFMNRLVMIRFYVNRSVAIRNLTLIETEGPGVRLRKLASREELLHLIEQYFEIPKQIAADAVAELGDSLEA